MHALTYAMDVLFQRRRREDCPYDGSCRFSQAFYTWALPPLSLSATGKQVVNADTYIYAETMDNDELIRFCLRKFESRE